MVQGLPKPPKGSHGVQDIQEPAGIRREGPRAASNRDHRGFAAPPPPRRREGTTKEPRPANNRDHRIGAYGCISAQRPHKTAWATHAHVFERLLLILRVDAPLLVINTIAPEFRVCIVGTAYMVKKLGAHMMTCFLKLSNIVLRPNLSRQEPLYVNEALIRLRPSSSRQMATMKRPQPSAAETFQLALLRDRLKRAHLPSLLFLPLVPDLRPAGNVRQQFGGHTALDSAQIVFDGSRPTGDLRVRAELHCPAFTRAPPPPVSS